MFDWLKRKPKIIPPPGSPPAAGERWQFQDYDDSPWPIEGGHFVTIRDAKEGWVRYSFGDGMFSDERKRLDDFTRMYRRHG